MKRYAIVYFVGERWYLLSQSKYTLLRTATKKVYRHNLFVARYPHLRPYCFVIVVPIDSDIFREATL